MLLGSKYLQKPGVWKPRDRFRASQAFFSHFTKTHPHVELILFGKKEVLNLLTDKSKQWGRTEGVSEFRGCLENGRPVF